MKYAALILGLTLPVTLLSCTRAETQTARQNVEFDSLEEKIAALEAQLGTNLKYEKDDDGNERWYDSKGNLIHEKRSDGYEKWHEYDSNGHLIHNKDSDGYEEWHEYDSRGNLIHYKNSNGYGEEWHEYDSRGKLIHYKNSNGYDDEWEEYDPNGNLIHYKNSDGYERWSEYDSNGHLIHNKYSDGDEEWYDYDSNGHLIHNKYSDGDEEWHEYDSRGNLIHYKDSDGHEVWYDSNGHLIHKKGSDGKKWDYYEKDGFVFRQSSKGGVTEVTMNPIYYGGEEAFFPDYYNNYILDDETCWLNLPSGFTTSVGKTVKWYDKQGICIEDFDGLVLYDSKGIPLMGSKEIGAPETCYVATKIEIFHYNDMGLLATVSSDEDCSSIFNYWNNGNIKHSHSSMGRFSRELAWDIKGNIEKYQSYKGDCIYFKDNKIIGVHIHNSTTHIVVAQYSPTGRLLKVQKYETPVAHYDNTVPSSVIEEFIKNRKPIKEWNGDEWTEEDDMQLGLGNDYNYNNYNIIHLNNGGKIELLGQTFSFVH